MSALEKSSSPKNSEWLLTLQEYCEQAGLGWPLPDPLRVLLTDPVADALEDAFRHWWGQNFHALELGGTGDVTVLWRALNAAAAKAS